MTKDALQNIFKNSRNLLTYFNYYYLEHFIKDVIEGYEVSRKSIMHA